MDLERHIMSVGAGKDLGSGTVTAAEIFNYHRAMNSSNYNYYIYELNNA